MVLLLANVVQTEIGVTYALNVEENLKHQTLKMKQNTVILNEKRRQRKVAIAEGFYDGRFRPRVVKDKKKESSKRACRRYTVQ